MTKQQDKAGIEQARRDRKTQRDAERETWRAEIIEDVQAKYDGKHNGFEFATLVGRELGKRLEERDEKLNGKGRK